MPVGPLRLIGKKHVELLTNWVGSAVVYGTAASVGVIYYTDWKTVLRYVPYYNGKFPAEEEK